MTDIAYRLQMTAPPEFLPLDLDDVKAHLRVTGDAEDAMLAALIETAAEACETLTGLALITREYSLFIDHWPADGKQGWWDGMREGAAVSSASPLALPRPPLQSVTAVKVFDDANAEDIFDAAGYHVDTTDFPGRIILKTGTTPPLPGRAVNGIEVQFTAGYGDAPVNIPAALKQGMKRLVAYLYEKRGDADAGGMEDAVAASGAKTFFQPFRRMRLA